MRQDKDMGAYGKRRLGHSDYAIAGISSSVSGDEKDQTAPLQAISPNRQHV